MPPMASSWIGHTAGPSGCDLAAIRRVCGIVESLGETWAASSGKVRWLDDPTGCRERASAAAWRIPGTWAIRNLYFNVFSFRFLSRGFGIASRLRSPNTLSRGLWSIAIVRLGPGQPRTKWGVFSNASTTASTSPLMGAYLDSADEVNRLPTTVTFQPEWQQSGFVGVQLQCFCRS